jgi:hypothetical protein
MKIFASKLFLLFCIVSFGQDSIKTFNLIFTTYNHAERIINGTTSYVLTDSSIKVTKTFLGERKDKTFYFRCFPRTNKYFSEIRRLELESLKDFYFNFCVLATSGDEYFIYYSDNLITKNINLHHYYLKELDTIIQIINSNVPKKYRFKYLTKETKQDCKLLHNY